LLFLENEITTETPAIPATAPTESAIQPQARFALGQIAATPGALQLLDEYHADIFELLVRHSSGNDWGDVGPEDSKTNDQALILGGRVLSSYTLRPGVADTRVWIITEWDRSVTTVLRPDEY